jgi:flagellar protein FlbD
VILLSRLNNIEFVLNADLIETIEATPDTIIKLTSGKTYLVKNSVTEVIQKAIAYKKITHESIQIIPKKND